MKLSQAILRVFYILLVSLEMNLSVYLSIYRSIIYLFVCSSVHAFINRFTVEFEETPAWSAWTCAVKASVNLGAVIGIQWVGSRENLLEIIDFPIKHVLFPENLPLNQSIEVCIGSVTISCLLSVALLP